MAQYAFTAADALFVIAVEARDAGRRRPRYTGAVWRVDDADRITRVFEATGGLLEAVGLTEAQVADELMLRLAAALGPLEFVVQEDSPWVAPDGAPGWALP